MYFGFFYNNFDSLLGYSDPVFMAPGTEACARMVREAALQNWANYITPLTNSKHQSEHQGLLINSVKQKFSYLWGFQFNHNHGWYKQKFIVFNLLPSIPFSNKVRSL
jgi:hypothetical protein